MRSFVITGLTLKGEKVVKDMYYNKDGKNRSKVRHELLSREPWSFRSVVTDRNLKKMPHNEEVFRQSMGLIFKASGLTTEDYKLEVENE